jgi:hypothetical protein
MQFVALPHKCCIATLDSKPDSKTRVMERTMAEYGEIFDYYQSAMGFEAMTMAFMAAYGLLIVWISSHAKDPALKSLRSA